MKSVQLRYAVSILLLFISAGLVKVLQFDSSKDISMGYEAIQVFPVQIGDWRGRDFPLNDNVYEILETRAIIHRNYTNKTGESVFLSIVHYHDTKVDFHGPEACLGGRGIKTTKMTKTLSLDIDNKEFTFDIAKVTSRNTNEQNLTYYFYKTGDFLGQNYIKMRLHIAKNRILSRDSSGTLIRISTNLKKTDVVASQLLKNFLTELLPIINETL